MKRGRNQTAREIRAILAEHGALDKQMIRRLTQPPLTLKAINRALERLTRGGVLDLIYSSHRSCFYQLTDEPTRRIASGSSSGRPLLRRQDRFHNQWCEFWIHHVKREFPEAEIVREFTIASHDLAKRILNTTGEIGDVVPDFLLILPETNQRRRIHIAFEIERTRKSDRRIIQKLRKYANQTFLDGLIYVCDSVRLSETIRQLFESNLHAQSQRIGHYADNFFLFSPSMSAGFDPLHTLLNVKAKSTDLNEWLSTLSSKKRVDLSNKDFS